jgi:hypothetical protein
MRKCCSFIQLFFSFFYFSIFLINSVEGSTPGESTLDGQYQLHCMQPSDINEYLPLLRKYASECSSVVAIEGNSEVAIWGMLKGLSEKKAVNNRSLWVINSTIDADKFSLAKVKARRYRINFTLWPANEFHILIEPTDMLFIDSLHTYCHLTFELENFASRVRKYICLHHTGEPWGNQNDHTTYKGNYSEYPSSYDRNKQGLWPAITDFLNKHPEWTLLEHHSNQHGFTILQRIDEKKIPETLYDPLVDRYLKSKIILCTGPSLNRYDMLKKTTETDLELIPFKKIFLTTNEPTAMDITFKGRKPDWCEFIQEQEKQIACTNCIISTLRRAVNDPEVQDDDIILFKHESVIINDFDLIKKAINKMVNGNYNAVVRSMGEHGGISGTDAFFVKVSAIRNIVKDLPNATHLPHYAWFCEAYVWHHIMSQVKNKYGLFYHHSNGGFTEMGFFHHPSYAEASRPYWNRQNRDMLFIGPSSYQ